MVAQMGPIISNYDKEIDYILETIFVYSLLFYYYNLKKIDISGSFNLLKISKNKNKYVSSIN